MKKFKTIRFFIQRLWQMNRSYVLVIVGQKLLISLRTLMVILIPKLLIDLVMQPAGRDRAIITIGLIGLASLLLYFFESVLTRIANVEKPRIELQFDQEFSDKLMRLPYQYLEDPVYLEMKEEAKMGFNIGSIDDLLDHLSLLLEKGITLIGLVALLMNLSPVLFVIICLLQLIVWYLLQRRSQLFRTTLQGILPINRKYNYFINAMLEDKVQKDVRLYDMSDMLTQNVYHYNELLIRDFIAMDWKDGIYASLNHLVNYLIAILVFFYSGMRVVAGTMNLGSFTLYSNAAINFSLAIRDAFSLILNVINKVHFIEPIEAFLSLPDEVMDRGKDFSEEIETIELRNVWFRYPKTEDWILKDISFTIQRGEKISIVGLNGAGKSTLVKLISRFFVPERGVILINGQDIQTYNISSYLKLISAVYQDFQLVNHSIVENIVGEDYQKAEARQRALELLTDLEMADKINSLPQGIDSYLGKYYHEDGIELSGGQLQKIAIARALYKDAQLIILDEPTSALDPVAEAEIYQHFNQLVGSKTALYISHRMSSSTFCDRIVVINQGELEAIDSHQNLMQDKQGLYYKLFQTQADHYQI